MVCHSQDYKMSHLSANSWIITASWFVVTVWACEKKKKKETRKRQAIFRGRENELITWFFFLSYQLGEQTLTWWVTHPSLHVTNILGVSSVAIDLPNRDSIIGKINQNSRHDTLLSFRRWHREDPCVFQDGHYLRICHFVQVHVRQVGWQFVWHILSNYEH